MNRINRLKNEFEKSSNDEGDGLTTAADNGGPNDNKIEKKIDNDRPGNTYRKGKDLTRQVAEEKSAAKLFSLNLISNKFKSNDLEALKGKKRASALL